MAIKNVDDLTPDEIANLTDAEMTALTQSLDGELDDSNAEKQKAEQAAPSASKEEVKTENDPVGILAKDGKSIIPIEVLQKERDKAVQATRTVEELNKTLKTTQDELELLRKKANEFVDFSGEKLSEEELEVLDMDLPEIAEKIRALQALAGRAEHLINQQKYNEVQSSVQNDIDSVPKLAYLQSSNPELFKFATQIDAELMQDTSNADMTRVQRFEKVIEKLEKAIGAEINMPNAKQKTIKVEDKTKITSLDDIPGGKPPEDDELMALVNKSPTELAAMMGNMTESQIDSFLTRATSKL